jgi:hypothetical protein
MVALTAEELEQKAQDLSCALDRSAGRLPEDFVTALKGRVDELLIGAATLRYETEKHDRNGRFGGPSDGV